MARLGDAARSLVVGEGTTRLMGVVNVTPDSFYDGGRWLDSASAVEHGLSLVEQGADILDIGGESTRPGHEPVSDQEQLERVLPVVEGLRARTATPISIDTTRATVAAAALAAGADWVNDTLALAGDPQLGPLVAERGCPIVLMHRFDPPRQPADRIDAPHGGRALVASIAGRLQARAQAALALGIRPERIILDPGVGFGTLPDDNLAIHAHLDALRALGYPLLVGTSRKSFLGLLTGKDPSNRLLATAASVATLTLGGVEIIRVHDVTAMRDVVRVADALRAAGAGLEGGA